MRTRFNGDSHRTDCAMIIEEIKEEDCWIFCGIIIAKVQ